MRHHTPHEGYSIYRTENKGGWKRISAEMDISTVLGCVVPAFCFANDSSRMKPFGSNAKHLRDGTKIRNHNVSPTSKTPRWAVEGLRMQQSLQFTSGTAASFIQRRALSGNRNNSQSGSRVHGGQDTSQKFQVCPICSQNNHRSPSVLF